MLSSFVAIQLFLIGWRVGSPSCQSALLIASRILRGALTQEEILALHVQILEPWKRGVVIAIGLLAAVRGQKSVRNASKYCKTPYFIWCA